MKRRSFFSALAGAFAAAAGAAFAGPVSFSPPMAPDERDSWRSCIRLAGESPAPRAGDVVTFREPFPGAYIVPGDNDSDIGTVVYHEEDMRFYACQAFERRGEYVFAEILPHTWAAA